MKMQSAFGFWCSVAGYFLIFAGFFLLTSWFGDPYIMKRAGAALLIYSTIFVYFAYLAEREAQLVRDEAAEPSVPEASALGGQAKRDLAEIEKAELLEAEEMRWKAFSAHVGLGLFGEMLHGFGDLLAGWALRIGVL